MRAISLALDVAPGLADVDLVDIAGADGLLFAHSASGYAGRGCARRIVLDDPGAGRAALDEIGHDDHSGVGARIVALGSFGFDPGSPTELIVPEVLVARPAGRPGWVTVVDVADVATAVERVTAMVAATETTERPPAVSPTDIGFTIEPLLSIEAYLAAVETARAAVAAGDLDKVVIARPIEVTSRAAFDIHDVLRRLAASFGANYRYSIDGLVGASPELLVEVDGETVRSHPLAGTAPRTGDPDTDARLAAELVASTKDQIEHRVVIESVHDTLLPFVSYLDWEPEPSIVTVANVQHLGSRVEGRLARPRPTALELARLLSPTPALGGHPRADALDLIATVEGFERGRYGGGVGWVDAAGDGEWAVTIRCAEFSEDRRRARLVAGGGIVAASDPVTELAETRAKFQAMLSALVRP